MRSLRTALLTSLLLTSVTAAQDVRNLRLVHRDGQTFVTWRESSQSATSYRVYRSTSRILGPADLDRADYLGEVDDQSSRNHARSQVTASEHYWVIEPGGAELSASDGLFVHNVVEASARTYYAVTSVRNGQENVQLKLGWNVNGTAVVERAAAPQPVLQTDDWTGQLWAHWVSNRASPFQPALAPWPSRGFNFRFEPGSDPAPRGLVLGLHAAGQNYAQGWPHRFELPRDVDLLSLHDTQPYSAFSFWFGAHEEFPGFPSAETAISNYTQQRVLWTLDWMSARLGAAHERERVYAVGGSMGAIGAMLVAGEAPERFAAILCRNGLYDLEADDYRNPGLFERLYGDFLLGLRTADGLTVLERFHAGFMASRDPRQEWPVIRTLNGRYDETVGWSSAVGLFQHLAGADRPAVHYFDERTHNPQGYWLGLERTLLARTCKVRRDRPALRFDRCTLDDDPGDGRRDDGDPVGTVNGYLDYDPATAAASADGLDFDLFLRDVGALDDSPSAAGWAALTPRRMGPFTLAPGERVRFVLTEGATRVDEHVLVADGNGLVHTPRVPLTRSERHARFERWSPGPGQLFLGAGPIPGDFLQAVANGSPGASYTLVLGIGTSTGAPFRRLGVDYILVPGHFGPEGFADLRFPMPRTLGAGSWIWGRVVTGGRAMPLVGVAVQFWP